MMGILDDRCRLLEAAFHDDAFDEGEAGACYGLG